MSGQSKRSPLDHVFQLLTLVSLALGIVSNVVGVWAHIEARQVRDDLETLLESKNWELSLKLEEPVEGSQVSGYVTRIAGAANFRTTAVATNTKINLLLEEKRIALVPLVRPLSGKWWWVQARPLVLPDGSFEGTVFVGDKESGADSEFQLTVLAVRKRSVSEGDRFAELPFFYTATKTVTIRRLR